MNDYYNTLGVARNASAHDIKRAYRRLASQHHPDRGGDTARFQQIEEAYRVLSDAQQRAAYDRPQPQPGFHFDFNHGAFDLNDFFAQAFGHQRRPQRSQFRTQIWVSLEQVHTGAEHHLRLSNSADVYRINIPQGVQDGEAVRYTELIPGADLTVEFRVHQHPVYQRQGLDLMSVHSVNVLELMAGTTIPVRVIDGQDLAVTVPALTQVSAKLRIAGRGLAKPGHRGDHYVLIEARLPDKISSELSKAIRQELNLTPED